MKKIPIALVCGIAAIAVTLLLYFTIFNNTIWEAVHFITLVGIIVAEAVTTGYACLMQNNPRKVAVTLLSAVMVPASVVLGYIYFVTLFNCSIYILLYCAATIAVNVFCYLLLRVDAAKTAETNQLQSAKDNMLLMRKMVKCIMADPAAAAYQDRLRRMEEDLHFSNDCVISENDYQIRQMLMYLQENISVPGFNVEQQLQQLEKAIQMRKIYTSRTV